MKLKEGFVLQEVAGETVVLPTGDDLDMNMMITLNSTARFLWELLEKETTKEALIDALLGEYGIDRGTAQECVDGFVEKLVENDFLA
ncbi:MAG: PqqD family protein [Oscillospiraceae bacterium]|nr:PqqD family protein [Oscillospiraceae bacterium]